MALDEFAELFAVFVFHVHEFDAVAFGADVANHGDEMDFPQASADFEFDGITDGEFLVRFEISATETDGFYARESRSRAVNLRAKRGFERNAGVAARNDKARIRVAGSGECGASASRSGAILKHGERIFGCRTETSGLGIGQAVAAAG